MPSSHCWLRSTAIPGVSRIELSGLDDTGVVALVEAAAGYALDEAAVGLAHALYQETDGNPFFVGEVLRHLSETRAIYLDATGRWVTEQRPDQMTPAGQRPGGDRGQGRATRAGGRERPVDGRGHRS